jgi:hypothetical protein
MNHPKRPRDTNQLAKSIVDIATGETEEIQAVDSRPTEIGRMGGLKGGKARAESLSADQRSNIARVAAVKRWDKK